MMNQLYILFLSVFLPMIPSHFKNPPMLPAPYGNGGFTYTPIFFDFSLKNFDPKAFELAKKECGNKLAQRINRRTKRYYEDYDYYCTFYGEKLNLQIYSLYQINTLKIAVDKGDAEAAYQLGEKYFYGILGWGNDKQESRQWYKKAADMGLTKAQFQLAHFYEEGWGGGKDPNKAKEIYEKLAQNGDIDAQRTLANQYFIGDTIPQDYPRSFYWSQKLAEKGDADAFYNLGMMYYNGIGVTKDYKKALFWVNRADEKDIKEAKYALGLMYEAGNGVPKNKSKALQYFKLACKEVIEDACLKYKKEHIN